MATARSYLTTGLADCVGCGHVQPIGPDSERCGCERRENLSVRTTLDAAAGDALRRGVAAAPASMWRYASLLPVPPCFASPLAVGWTPLIACGDATVRLLLKDETRNPSGSLKDRASEVVVAVAVAHGIRRVVVASTGNAAASLACIGAAAGIEVTVLVPETAPPAKLAQVAAYGATVHRVAGRYDDACEMAARVAAAEGMIDRSTGRNPFTREGKKTCAFEIAEQLGWQAPDWVIVPTGDGNILSALWKGFDELVRLGLLERGPRMVAVQSDASCAIAAAHDARLARTAVDDARLARIAGTTIADSITVEAPRDATAALAALAASDGLAVTVSDTEITAAVMALASRHGVFAEPSSAAGYAAFERLRDAGRFAPGDRVVCVVTGTGLKDVRPVLAARALDREPAVAPADWRRLLRGPGPARAHAGR